MLPIKVISEHKAAFVRPILESLPEWFGIFEATEGYIASAETLAVLGCEDEQGPVGVVSLRKRFPQTFEIDVMGVVPRWHRKGIGQTLIRAVEDYAMRERALMLTVKTLGPSNPDKNYAATRAFYESVGFVPLEEFKTLWDDGNPCLLMAKMI